MGHIGHASNIYWTKGYQRGTRDTEKVTNSVTEKSTIVLHQMFANPHIPAEEVSGIVEISVRKIKENIKKPKEKGLVGANLAILAISWRLSAKSSLFQPTQHNKEKPGCRL